MDCKTCKNYEPKDAPFDGVKTGELKIGMVFKAFQREVPTDGFYVITGEPDKSSVPALYTNKGIKPFKHDLDLALRGCQPYSDGLWSQNHLQEVT